MLGPLLELLLDLSKLLSLGLSSTLSHAEKIQQKKNKRGAHDKLVP